MSQWTDDHRVGAWELEGLGFRRGPFPSLTGSWRRAGPHSAFLGPAKSLAWKIWAGPVIHVANGRKSGPAKTPHAPLAACGPRPPEVSRLEWLALLAVPTPVLSRSLTGPPLAQLGALGAVLLAAQGPEDGAVSSTWCGGTLFVWPTARERPPPGSCGDHHLEPSRPSRAGGCGWACARSTRPRPARGATDVLFLGAKDNRSGMA